jgi:glycogen(starch) synthase
VRILCHCDGYLTSAIGGVEVLSYHLQKELRARGHEVLVLTTRIGDELLGPARYQDQDIVRLDFHGALKRRDLAHMRDIRASIAGTVERFKPEILHLNDSQPSSFFFLKGGATGSLKRVLTLHSPIRPSEGLQNRLIAEADSIVAVSDSIAFEAAAIADTKEKMRVIKNALPAPIATPPLATVPAHFVCAGRVVRDKGFDIAIRALAMIRERGMDARLTIAGNGPERKPLEQLSDALGVTKAVTFAGWVMPEDVSRLMQSATAILMPSRWREPFGLVALQAMQSATPVIASAIGGLPEVVEHGVSGLLVPPEDANALTDALGSMLADAEKTVAMGLRARDRAGQLFDFARFVDAYEALFSETAGIALASKRSAA